MRQSNAVIVFFAYATPFLLRMAFDFLYLGRTFYDPMAGEALSHVFECGNMWSFNWPAFLHGGFGLSHYPSVFHCQVSGILIKYFGLGSNVFFILKDSILLLDVVFILLASLWMAALSRRVSMPVWLPVAVALMAAVSPGSAWYFQIYYVLAVFLPPIGVGLFVIASVERSDKFAAVGTFVGLGVLSANHVSIGAVVGAVVAAILITEIGTKRSEIFNSLSERPYPRLYSAIAIVCFLLIVNGFVIEWTDAWIQIVGFVIDNFSPTLAKMKFGVYLAGILGVAALYAVLYGFIKKWNEQRLFTFLVATVGNICVGLVGSMNITIFDSWQMNAWRWLVRPDPATVPLSIWQFVEYIFVDPWRLVILFPLIAGLAGLAIPNRAMKAPESRKFYLGFLFSILVIMIGLFWHILPEEPQTYDIIAKTYFIDGRHFTPLIVILPIILLWVGASTRTAGKWVSLCFAIIALSSYILEVRGSESSISWSKNLETKTNELTASFLNRYPDGEIICGAGVFHTSRCFIAQSYNRALNRYLSNAKNKARGIPVEITSFKFKVVNGRTWTGPREIFFVDRDLLYIDLKAAGVSTVPAGAEMIYEDRHVAIHRILKD